MPLPQLDTSGIDVTNTISKIAAMKHQDMLNQNMQSEIAHRTAQEQHNNAIEVINARKADAETKKEQMETLNKGYDYLAKSFGFMKEHPNQPEQYQDFYDTHTSIPEFKQMMPPPAAFYTGEKDTNGNPTWNKKGFTSYANNAMEAVKLLRDPGVGKTYTVPERNKQYDPKAKDSYEWVNQRYVIGDDYKPYPVGDPTPNLDMVKRSEDVDLRKQEIGIRKEGLDLSKKREARESSGTWSYVGTSDDGTHMIYFNNKTMKTKSEPVPKPEDAKPGSPPAKIEAKPSSKKSEDLSMEDLYKGGKKDNKKVEATKRYQVDGKEIEYNFQLKKWVFKGTTTEAK